jgi:glutathione-regulated potassium-efflux system ancillary protein KefF
MIYLVFAHPYPSQSRANRVLLDSLDGLSGLAVCSLYDRYPDFDIDIAAEQAALRNAHLIIWMHPVYWYSVPALLKHWFDKVLSYGWAYGDGHAALQGKDCLWVATTGGTEDSYSPEGMHQMPFANYALPIEETARFCGMNWLEPFTVHGAHTSDGTLLASRAQQLRQRLEEWQAAKVGAGRTAPLP